MRGLTWERATPGPILMHYRPIRPGWGAVLSRSGRMWLFSFGAFGHALAIGWFGKDSRDFGDRTFRLGRT